jgi:RNA polymerase sigma-70 factor (ECF subfamily)
VSIVWEGDRRINPTAISHPQVGVGSRGSEEGGTPAEREPGGGGIDPWVVWSEHRRWVAAILLAYKPRWADLDDLLQEVALAVVRHGGELRDPSAVKPWLRSVAINAARAAARSGNVRQAYLESLRGERFEGVSTDGGGLETEEESSRVLREAMELPEGYREPLILKALRDLSYRQIGEVLGLPETTVETRIARARRMLRERLGGVSGREPLPSGDERPRDRGPSAGGAASSQPRRDTDPGL